MLTIQQCANLLQSGKVVPAINGFKQLLASNAKDVDAHQLIGVGYIMANDYKLAEKHLLKCLKLAPNHLDAKYNLARLYTQQKKFSKAMLNLQSVLKQRPDWLQARFALGLAAIGLQDKELAKASFKMVADAQPQNFEAWTNIGTILFEQREYADAKVAYEKAIQANPNYEDSILGLAKCIQNLVISNESVLALKEHAERLKTPKVFTELARAYRLLGDKQQVVHYAGLAMKVEDILGEAHKLYYDSCKIESVDDLEPLKKALENQELTSFARINMHFSMSKGLDALGEYKQSLEHLDAGNNLRRQEYKYSTAESLKLFNMLKDSYSLANLSNASDASEQGEGLVFIVGMPRSGTSLVEQIIASHSEVFGAGELELLRHVWKRTKSSSEAKFHTQLLSKSVEEKQSIGQIYLDAVDKMQGSASVLTDKMPHNFLMIGFIASVLPKAKIIHCKRHPIANCLSIYKADFTTSHGYAFNQKELAEYHNLYEDLMEHWRQVLPGQFFEIKYEDLTSNQEEETRKLIAYCGLPWEDACLNFHSNKRAVKTVSAYQVRQKMHNKSVDLWKRYGDGLKPLIDNLYIPEEYQDQ